MPLHLQQSDPVTEAVEISPESVTEAMTAAGDEAARSVAAGATESHSPLDRLVDTAVTVWDHRFTIGETTIGVDQLVIALFWLIAGYILSKLIARRVGNKVLPRMKVEPGPASAIQTILYYILLIATAMIALQIAQVPLTVFTIFGGALALGIGFGSQNVMNNFISGLILLLERPIQVNDLVTVGNDTGTVLKIGARATQIQRYDGVTVIVPNSHMLENAVANWAIPDRRIRSVIKVGVAYGSDVRLVKETLEQLLNDHIRVLESPDNRVLFAGFGDSSLDFEVHFWISPRSSFDRRQIESDLRFKIDALFREHGISIPFPQRDVHLFNLTPAPDQGTPQGQS